MINKMTCSAEERYSIVQVQQVIMEIMSDLIRKVGVGNRDIKWSIILMSFLGQGLTTMLELL